MVEPDVPFVCPLTYNQWNTVIQWNYLWPTHHDTISFHTSEHLNVCRSGRTEEVNRGQWGRHPWPWSSSHDCQPFMWQRGGCTCESRLWAPEASLATEKRAAMALGPANPSPTAEMPRTLVLRPYPQRCCPQTQPSGTQQGPQPQLPSSQPLPLCGVPHNPGAGGLTEASASSHVPKTLGKTNEKFKASGNTSDRAGKGGKC